MRSKLVAAIILSGSITSTTVDGMTADNPPMQKNGGQKLAVDVQAERVLQAEVDKGHQPWRLDAIFVSIVFINKDWGEKLTVDQCRQDIRTEREVLVQCEGRRRYTVKLRRLFRVDGIWSPVEITRF
jgi:hypothetical protein